MTAQQQDPDAGQRRFDIYAVSVQSGEVAICPVPGGEGDYCSDLRQICQWSPELVVSMTTEQEQDDLGAAQLAQDLMQRGIRWAHFAVVDYGIPTQEQSGDWHNLSLEAHAVLSRGGRVLLHCRGGCGRSGMGALRLMVDAGEAGDDALRRLRQIRPCAVETEAQMRWAMHRHASD